MATDTADEGVGFVRVEHVEGTEAVASTIARLRRLADEMEADPGRHGMGLLVLGSVMEGDAGQLVMVWPCVHSGAALAYAAAQNLVPIANATPAAMCEHANRLSRH